MRIIRATSVQNFNDALSVVSEVFTQFLAPDYSLEGIETFFKLVNLQFLVSLSKRNGFVLISIENNEPSGVIAFRDFNHI